MECLSTSGPQKWARNLAALEKWEAAYLNKTGVLDYGAATPESMVFAANTSCVLIPTVTDGPYYVWGEVLRRNVKEQLYSDGVDLFLEVQYIDIDTCRPVPGAVVDIWQANATGVYWSVFHGRALRPKALTYLTVAFQNRATMRQAAGTRLTCAALNKQTRTGW